MGKEIIAEGLTNGFDVSVEPFDWAPFIKDGYHSWQIDFVEFADDLFGVTQDDAEDTLRAVGYLYNLPKWKKYPFLIKKLGDPIGIINPNVASVPYKIVKPGEALDGIDGSDYAISFSDWKKGFAVAVKEVGLQYHVSFAMFEKDE